MTRSGLFDIHVLPKEGYFNNQTEGGVRMKMTPEQRKEAKGFGVGLLVIVGVVVVAIGAYLFGANNIPGRTQAAIAAFSGSTAPPAAVQPAASYASFVAPKEEPQSAPKKQNDAPPATLVAATSSFPQFPKQVQAHLGWTKKGGSQRNVFKVPEIQFSNREFTLFDAGLAKAVCNQLIAGPSDNEGEKGYRSEIDAATKVLSIKIENGTLYLKLSIKPSKIGERQFRETLEKLEGVKKVEFL